MNWLQRHPLIYPIFSLFPSPLGRGVGVRAISVPFARENLHLVIPPPAGSSRYISVIQLSSHFTMAAIVHSAFESVKWQNKTECSEEHSVHKAIPRLCRVLLGFEPAIAGGSLPSNAALAQAYRVVTVKLRTLLGGIGSKRKGNIANTAGYDFYTILHVTRKEIN